MEKSTWIRFRSDPELKKLLEDVAEQRDQPASSLARQILRTGLTQVAQQSKDPLQIEIIQED